MECEEDWAADKREAAEKEEPLEGAVVFENVTFAYPGGSGEPALKDISFQISPRHQPWRHRHPQEAENQHWHGSSSAFTIPTKGEYWWGTRKYRLFTRRDSGKM